MVSAPTAGRSSAECVKYGNSAIGWIREHAIERGIVPERIAAGGGSAGGHVAAAAGTTKGFEDEGEDLNVSARPDALILLNPVYYNGPDGSGHSRVNECWKAFSAMHNIDETTPPTIVVAVHGGAKQVGVPVRLNENDCPV